MSISRKIKEFVENPPDDFSIKEVEFCGIDSLLIGPKNIRAKWTQENKIFRSLVVDRNSYKVLSSGFPRFVNLGENPENFPPPSTLEKARTNTKLDGSLMICDLVNGKFSMRTRGTASYRSLENFTDFERAVDRYPGIRRMLDTYGDSVSLLFEIVSPNQRIVIDYGKEVDAFLVGAVRKEDCYMFPNYFLDIEANARGLKRPDYHEFETLENLITHTKGVEGMEGYCIYHGDQQIHKIKGDWYLALHRMKSELGNYQRVAEFFSQCGFSEPGVRDKFAGIVACNFDFEIAERCGDHVDRVCRAWDLAHAVLQEMYSDIDSRIRDMPTRKEQAAAIMSRHKDHAPIAFLRLDGKEVPGKKILDLILKFSEEEQKPKKNQKSVDIRV